MLICRDVVKEFKGHGGTRRVLKGINLTVKRGEKIGILGHNGAGKSTLLRLIGGIDFPTSGYINSTMSVSWPLAFSGAFQGSLSGLDNLKFICRIYNIDYKDTREYVDDFAQLGKQLLEPVKVYSSGMRARLAFALSMAIDFDCYLIDEVIMVGDARFTHRCQDELFGKKGDRSLILVSHNDSLVKEFCDSAAILHNGLLISGNTVDEAMQIYKIL